MKDTAVKFLIDEISCRFIISEELRIAMYKAIAMEKEQIIDAYFNGCEVGEMFNNENRAFTTDAEKYYQENCKPEII
jgi:hypothetical protein